jgi:hypothetical protein
MSNLLGLSVTVWTCLWVFLFVLAVLWFLLPFAVFGSKRRLDKIVNELQMLNKTMKEISSQNRVIVDQQKLLLPRGSRALPDPGDEMR